MWIERPMNRTAKKIASDRSMSGAARGADRPRIPVEPLSGKD
jgi:hypothetical protein